MSQNVEEYTIAFKERGLGKGLKNAERGFDKVNTKAETLNKKLSVGTKLAAGIAAVTVASFVKSSIAAFDKQAKAEAQVRQGLASTQGAAGRTFAELTKMASDLQKKTIFGDEDILLNATSQLITFTNITGKQFDRTQAMALDLATRLEGDLKGATIQLGKALNDPIKNVSALARSGIAFSESQLAMIKSLQNTNQLGKAQTIILDELQKQYGGSAEAAAAAGTGGFTQLGNTLGDIKEAIGAALMPVLNIFAQVISYIAGLIQNNNAGFTLFVQTLAVLIAIITSLVLVIKAWTAIQAVINALLIANPIGIVVMLIALLIAGIIKAYKSSETFRGILAGIGNVFSTIWKFLKSFFVPIFTKLWDVFKRVGAAVVNFLKKPIEAVYKAFQKFLDLLEKIPGVGSMIKNLRESFSEGFKKGVKDFRKEQEKTKLKAAGVELDAAGNPTTGTGTGVPTKDTTPKAGTVSSAAPKQFNINIESLVKEFQIVTNQLAEADDQIRENITNVFLEALADVQTR